MSEQVGNKQIIQGEDIVVTVDGKPTLHATNHSLKVDLEVKDIRTKTFGTNNRINTVKATLEGLKGLRNAETVAKMRGKTVEEILG